MAAGVLVLGLCAPWLLRRAPLAGATRGGQIPGLSLRQVLRDRRFGYPLEMVVRAADAGWRIAEVDVDYAPRAEGTRSKVTGTVLGTARTVRDMARVLAA